MVGKFNIYAYVILAFSFIFLASPLSASATTAQENPKITSNIIDTWPSADVKLNVPPREFKIVLGAVKDTRDYKAFIQKSDENYPTELGRVTKGEASIIYFSAPLLTPGSYKAIWETPTGASNIQFTILEATIAPGGGNHRHEFALNLKKFEDNAYTVLILLIVFTLLALNLRIKPVFAIIITVLGLIATLALLGKSVYSSYESSGAIDEELWKSLADNEIWSHIMIIALIAMYPFIYYLTTAFFRILWGVGLALLYAGKNFGHPSIPYFETFITESLVILAVAYLLAILYTRLFTEKSTTKFLSIAHKNVAINMSGATYLVVFAVTLLNFTSYSGFNYPAGLFVTSLVFKIVALLILGLLSLFSTYISRKSKIIKLLAFTVALTCGSILAISPPLAAGI